MAKGLKFIAEATIETSTEDGGAALIAEPIPFDTLNSDEDNGMFVKIQSWDEDTEHTDMQKLIGKKVRITIEIID